MRTLACSDGSTSRSPNSVRQLIEATLSTEAGDDVVAVGEGRDRRRHGEAADPSKQRHAWDHASRRSGDTVAWGNVAIGPRNPLAPPLEVEEDSPTRAHLDTPSSAPPTKGLPDTCTEATAPSSWIISSGTWPATATPTRRWRQERSPSGIRGRPASVGFAPKRRSSGTDGRKIYVTGHLADEEGVTVTAEGVFIAAEEVGLGGLDGRDGQRAPGLEREVRAGAEPGHGHFLGFGRGLVAADDAQPPRVVVRRRRPRRRDGDRATRTAAWSGSAQSGPQREIHDASSWAGERRTTTDSSSISAST